MSLPWFSGLQFLNFEAFVFKLSFSLSVRSSVVLSCYHCLLLCIKNITLNFLGGMAFPYTCLDANSFVRYVQSSFILFCYHVLIHWTERFWFGGWQDNKQDMLLCIISATSSLVDALFVSINRWGAWIRSAALDMWLFLWKWFVYQHVLWFY